MPAILAHHLFGTEAFSACSDRLRLNANNSVRDAFLLGNNAPDALFCLKALPLPAECKRIGATVHSEKPAEFFEALHHRFIEAPQGDSQSPINSQINAQPEVLEAFALGLLCHYLLDSTAHPFVLAQQFALCDCDAVDLSRENDGGNIHALIETELDEYLVAKKLGASVMNFPPHREALQLEPASLHSVSATFSNAVSDCYGICFPVNALALGVHSYRIAQRMLDSKRDGLRKHFDYGRLAGRRYQRVQALTHSPELRTDTLFANNDHIAWQHPFDPTASISESFDEVYERALESASIAIPLFSEARFTVQRGGSLGFTVDFYGKPV